MTRRPGPDHAEGEPEDAPHRVILASAGTGKTHQLTTRCIRLLAAGEDPASILATTFTRRAAGEILDRVLGRIAGAAFDPEGLADLAASTGLPLTHERCRDLATATARSLHLVSIGTIDALFLRMASAMAMELGPPPGWRIATDLEAGRVTGRAVADTLKAIDPAEMLELLRGVYAGSPAAPVSETITGLIARGAAAWRSTREAPHAWDHVAPETEPLPGDDLDRAVADLAAACRFLPRTAKGEPNGHWASALDASLRAAESGDWEAFVGKGLGDKLVAGETRFQRHDIPPEFRAAFGPLVAHAKAVLVGQVADRNRAVRDLLSRFVAALDHLKQSTGLLDFDDVPRILLDSAGGGDLALRVLERADARARHLLVDEFQDTSVTQFRLLDPLIGEITSAGGGRTFMCVGDAKQSLYGWREAEPGLLAALPARYPGLSAEGLHDSRRSGPAVLAAVNGVFASLESVPALRDSADAIEQWRSLFRPQESALPDRPGQARLVAVAPRPDPDETDPDATEENEPDGIDADSDGTGEDGPGAGRAAPPELLDAAADRAASLHRDAPAATIAILVRRNKAITPLIRRLGARGVAASEEGGSPVVDSPAVAAAASLLWWADHPGDTEARYHAETSPFAGVIGLTPGADPRRTALAWASWRARLAADGLGPSLLRLLRRTAPTMDQRDGARFRQLIDMAGELDASGPRSPSSLAELARTRPVEDPSASPVRVMTVHAAKGLQFDAVILPDLAKDWGLKHTDLLTDRPDPFGPIDRVSVNAAEEIRRLSPALADLHRRAMARVHREELGVLYVAMTRARYSLDLLVPARKLKLCAAAVVAQALAPDAGLALEQQPGGTDLWSRRHGGAWTEQFREARADSTTRAGRELRLADRPRRPALRARPVTPSGLAGAGRVAVAELLDASGSVGRDRGALVHRWFELVGWREDGSPSRDDLIRIAAEHGWPDAAPLADRFASVLDGPIGAALTRARYADRGAVADLRREWRFAVTTDHNGSPTLLTGQFDRLVIVRDGAGTPRAAEVIDFKTDADTLSAADRYRDQLAAYRRAAAALLGLPPADVRATLALIETGELVDV